MTYTASQRRLARQIVIDNAEKLIEKVSWDLWDEFNKASLDKTIGKLDPVRQFKHLTEKQRAKRDSIPRYLIVREFLASSLFERDEVDTWYEANQKELIKEYRKQATHNLLKRCFQDEHVGYTKWGRRIPSHAERVEGAFRVPDEFLADCPISPNWITNTYQQDRTKPVDHGYGANSWAAYVADPYKWKTDTREERLDRLGLPHDATHDQIQEAGQRYSDDYKKYCAFQGRFGRVRGRLQIDYPLEGLITNKPFRNEFPYWEAK